MHPGQPPSSPFLYFKSQTEGGGITLQIYLIISISDVGYRAAGAEL